MAKRFRLRFRISRVFPSFQSCRSKDLPESPLPANSRLSPADPNSSPPRPPSLKRHVSSAIASVSCGCRSKSNRPITTTPVQTPPHFQWQKEDKWHVIAKVPDHHNRNRRQKILTVDSSFSDDYSSFPSATTDGTKSKKKKIQRKKLKKKKKKKSRYSIRISTSSFDHSGWFSSSEKEAALEYDETETLVSSSRSFSDDSFSEFNPSLKTIQERNPPRKGFKKVKLIGKRKSFRTRERGCPSPETDSPARVSVFRRLVPCGLEGKVRESFAVVKRSEDPYGDFKRSMLEMILEKEMYEKGDLEQLLHCFLSLNSRAHHRAIVDAFSEIWQVLFCKNPNNGVSETGLCRRLDMR